MRTAKSWTWLIACALVAGLATHAAGQLGPEWVDIRADHYGASRVVVGNAGDVFVMVDTYGIQWTCSWWCEGNYGQRICCGEGCAYGSETHAIVKYSPGGETSWIDLEPGGGQPLFAVDRYDNVYVTDNGISKFSTDGDLIWRRNEAPTAWGLAVDSAGNVYVTGHKEVGTSTIVVTIKHSPDGYPLWERNYDLGDFNWAEGLAVDGAGNVYVTGYCDGDYATIKYSPDGDTLWTRRYNGSGNGSHWPRAIAVDDSGSVYVTGTSQDITGTGIATIKYSSSGDLLWDRRYDDAWVSYLRPAQMLALDASGNAVVAGARNDIDGVTIKYSPAGDTLWIRHQNLKLYSSSHAIATDADGNVYVGAGYGAGEGIGGYAVKYSPTGDTLWIRRQGIDPEGFAGGFGGVAVDGDGNAYFAGRFGTLGQFWDCDFGWGNWDHAVIAKYSDPVGDVNCDGICDWSDLLSLSHVVDGLTSPGGPCGDGQSDVDADGDVDEHDCNLLSDLIRSTLGPPMGDVNLDGVITQADILHLANHVFKGVPAPSPLPDAGDMNCDSTLAAVDILLLVNYVFKSSAAPQCS